MAAQLSQFFNNIFVPLVHFNIQYLCDLQLTLFFTYFVKENLFPSLSFAPGQASMISGFEVIVQTTWLGSTVTPPLYETFHIHFFSYLQLFAEFIFSHCHSGEHFWCNARRAGVLGRTQVQTPMSHIPSIGIETTYVLQPTPMCQYITFQVLASKQNYTQVQTPMCQYVTYLSRYLGTDVTRRVAWGDLFPLEIV